MENDQYFNFEVTHFHTEEMFLLKHRMNMEGCGIYVNLLCYLRTCDGFRGCCNEAVLEGLARQYGVKPKKVASVIQDFGLFEMEEDGVHFRSPYLDRVTACLVKKRTVMKPASAAVPAGKTTTVNDGKTTAVNDGKTTVRPVTVKRLADGRFTGKETAVRNSRVEKSKVEKSREENSSNSRTRETAAAADLPPVVIDSSPVRTGWSSGGDGVAGWHRWVDEMVTDRSWMELVGMRSGLGELFIRKEDCIISRFREHVELYAKGDGLRNLRDVRQYFANYMARGSRTCGELSSYLLALRSVEKKKDPYCFETVVDGKRTYYGYPIPPDAPPRPDNMSAWDDIGKQWLR